MSTPAPVPIRSVECVGDPIRGQRSGDPLFVGQVVGGSALRRSGSPLGPFPQARCCSVFDCPERGGCRHGVHSCHSVCGFHAPRGCVVVELILETSFDQVR